MSRGVPGDGLWAPHRRALTLGLVLTVTFIASEALAVVTVMPVVARDLNGLALYGWVFSTFQLASLIGIVVAGRDADRHGPARPYVAGLVLFSAGLLVAGLAPSMWVLVVGRCLQGLGAGAVPAVAYVAIGRSLREAQRARMMAVLSTAWVVPGIVGPGVAAAVAHLFGWRWVFLGLIPLVAVAGPIALPALLRLGRPDAAPADEHRVADAVRTAVGAALVLGALGSRDLLVGLGLAAVAGASSAWRRCAACSRPARCAARRGLPATILSRGLLTFALLRCGRLRDADHHDGAPPQHADGRRRSSPHRRLAWTAGSWIQARLNDQWEGPAWSALGLLLILAGTAGMAWQLRPGVPVWEAFVAWSVAGSRHGPQLRADFAHDAAGGAPGSRGLGLGVTQPGRRARRWRSASGVGGAAVAAVSRGDRPIAGGVVLAFAAAALAAVLALVVVAAPAGFARALPAQPVTR